MRRIQTILVIALLALASAAVRAQSYPAKAIRWIVPAPPGSPPDSRARWLAPRLATAMGQPVVVENKSGAGGTLGAAVAAKSAPDGYTIVSVHQGTLAFNPFLYAQPGYDPIKDFAPITRMAGTPLLLSVYPGVDARSLADLVRLAKAAPGQLTFGSAGTGSVMHIADALFRRMTDIDVTHVPYKGGNLALVDLMAGRITYSLTSSPITLAPAKAGKVRILAVTSAERLPFLPEVPTFAESGLPGYEYATWSGICAPAGTPQSIIARLNAEFGKVLRSPESIEWSASQGDTIASSTPEEFAALIKSEIDKWGPIIREAGIKGE